MQSGDQLQRGNFQLKILKSKVNTPNISLQNIGLKIILMMTDLSENILIFKLISLSMTKLQKSDQAADSGENG